MSATRQLTQARTRIADAVHRHGLEVESMEYDHCYHWTVFVKGHGVVTGYSWQEVVQSVDMLAPGWLDGTIFG